MQATENGVIFVALGSQQRLRGGLRHAVAGKSKCLDRATLLSPRIDRKVCRTGRPIFVCPSLRSLPSSNGRSKRNPAAGVDVLAGIDCNPRNCFGQTGFLLQRLRDAAELWRCHEGSCGVGDRSRGPGRQPAAFDRPKRADRGLNSRCGEILATTRDNVFDDYANYYTRDTLGEFVVILAPAAVFANSDWDADVGDWYQQHVRSDATNRAAAFFRPLGNGYYTIPVYVSAKFLGEYFDDQPGMALLGEFGDRTTRALLVGGPPLLALQYLTGGGRPSDLRRRIVLEAVSRLPRRQRPCLHGRGALSHLGRHDRRPAGQVLLLRLLALDRGYADQRQCPLSLAGLARLVDGLPGLRRRQQDRKRKRPAGDYAAVYAGDDGGGAVYQH